MTKGHTIPVPISLLLNLRISKNFCQITMAVQAQVELSESFAPAYKTGKEQD